MIKTNFEISINRISSNREEEDGKFCLRIIDDKSNQMVVEILLSGEQLALILSGRSEYASGKVGDSEFFGKKKKSEKRTVEIPKKLNYDRDNAEKWLRENYKEEGKFVNASLRSQNSFYTKDGKDYANFSVYWYE